MGESATLIQSIASLMWPLVVAGIIIFLLPALRQFIGHSDSIELEVAGSKVSIQRASEEVRKLINDLQDRVNELEATLPSGPSEGRVINPSIELRRSVLWVDDRLEANVYERARLVEAGYRVLQAESTTVALNLLRSEGPFDLIISDVARVEAGGELNPKAGLDLLRRIREMGESPQIIFYSSQRSLSVIKPALNTEDNVAYTTSPSELMLLVGVAS